MIDPGVFGIRLKDYPGAMVAPFSLNPGQFLIGKRDSLFEAVGLPLTGMLDVL